MRHGRDDILVAATQHLPVPLGVPKQRDVGILVVEVALAEERGGPPGLPTAAEQRSRRRLTIPIGPRFVEGVLVEVHRS